MKARVMHIAFNTFREAVRDRVLYNLIAFARAAFGSGNSGRSDFHRH